MLRLMQLEELADLLLRLPALVQQQSRRAVVFPQSVAAWLETLEKALVACRLHQAGSIAMLRGGLLAAEQGQIPVGLEFRGRPTRTKVLNALASQALQRASEIASSVLTENRAPMVDAERVAQQIGAAAVARSLVTRRPPEVGNTDYLRALRRKLAAVPDLENAATHLEGLVGPYDALILLDRALTPFLEALPESLPITG